MKKRAAEGDICNQWGQNAVAAGIRKEKQREFGNDSNELIPDISGACYSQLSAGSFSTLLTNAAMKAD